MRSVRDWTALPTELLECITNRLTLIEDFNAFRGVCTSWRAVKTKFVSKVPLLMLAENDGSDEREFYSLAKRRICMRIPLPGTIGKRCIDAGFGWILTIAPSGDVCLLEPFSAARIELPNIKTFPKYIANSVMIYFIRGALLTADPSETLNFKVVVAMHGFFGFWKNGGENWTRIDPGGFGIVYCKELEKMYTLDLKGHILIWDPQGTDLAKPQGQVKVYNSPNYLGCAAQYYLVQSTDGELLMITRNNTGTNGYFAKGADHFRVMRVDLVTGEFTEIDGLGKDAIFIGDHAGVSVDASEFPGVLKPNCIYFMDDCLFAYPFDRLKFPQGGGKDMGVYNVEDRSIERFSVESFSRVSPPLWVFPQF